MRTARSELQHAQILNTTAVNGAFEHPTPDVAWACADADPEVFFPTDDDALTAATAICAGCAVRTLCRTIAEARAESGVWGGVLLAEGVVQDGVRRRGRPAKVAAVA